MMLCSSTGEGKGRGKKKRGSPWLPSPAKETASCLHQSKKERKKREKGAEKANRFPMRRGGEGRKEGG